MVSSQINFEVLDVDLVAPSIIDSKVVQVGQTKFDLRISCDESVYLSYLLTEQGTLTPTAAEIITKATRDASATKPNVTETHGMVHSFISQSTRSYIYYDSYINMTALSSATDYLLYMVPVDLSGNIGGIKSVLFTTKSRPPPVTFTLKAKAALTATLLLNSLSLVTGKTGDYFQIVATPNTSSIVTDEALVTAAIASASLQYTIMINNIEGSDQTPMELLQIIENEKVTLFSEVPDLDSNQDIGSTGREQLYSEQALTYDAKVLEITTYSVKFNVSIQYTGKAYGVILPSIEKAPSVQQIKRGLNAANIQTSSLHADNVALTISEGHDYAMWPHANLAFSFLYHSTEYTAYFAADRSTTGYSVLMSDKNVKTVKVKTSREIFTIDESYKPLSRGELVGVWVGM
jgi:hypothetical protein